MTNTSITPLDIDELVRETGNIYHAVSIIAKHAEHLSAVQKTELTSKLAEFASPVDNLEEIFENKEQIEISRYYERLPKNTLVATDHFTEGEVLHRPFPEDEEE